MAASPDPRPARRRAVAAAAVAALVTVVLFAMHRECGGGGDRGATVPREGAPGEADRRAGAPASSLPARPGSTGAEPGAAPAPSLPAWRAAAEATLEAYRDVIAGGDPWALVVESEGARAALAEAAAADRTEIRRLLLGTGREREIALVTMARSGLADEELLALAVRLQRPEDDEIVRLVGADVMAGMPGESLARLQDDVVRALSGETNPLVFVLALPGLERMDEAHLVELLARQLRLAGPEMRPILYDLARQRVGAASLADLRAALGREAIPAGAF